MLVRKEDGDRGGGCRVGNTTLVERRTKMQSVSPLEFQVGFGNYITAHLRTR